MFNGTGICVASTVPGDHVSLGAGGRKVKNAQHAGENNPANFHGSPGFSISSAPCKAAVKLLLQSELLEER
jgi:hypothetical protein